MYVPKSFAEEDRQTLHGLIRQASFAALVTAAGGAPEATHLPLVLDTEAGEHGRLLGHVARANGHWRTFDGDTEALCIFSGPHAYISPNWYASDNMVPTWNYAAVHAYGRPRVIDEPQKVIAVLERLAADNESAATGNWTLDRMDERIMRGMLKGIVAFEMPIERMQGKFKMSQNRKPEDVRGAIDGLRGLVDATAAAVAAEMEKRLS